MSALPRLWVTPNTSLWGQNPTYGNVPWDLLPRLPFGPDATFRWLQEFPETPYSIVEDHRTPNGAAMRERLHARRAEASALGLELPAGFVAFMESLPLQQRVPTNTACFLDLGEVLIERKNSPREERLLRFLNDQQFCCCWFLRIGPKGHDVIVAEADLPEEIHHAMPFDSQLRIENAAICADDFGEFIQRFWLENALWFVKHQNVGKLNDAMRAYLADVEVARSRPQSPTTE